MEKHSSLFQRGEEKGFIALALAPRWSLHFDPWKVQLLLNKNDFKDNLHCKVSQIAMEERIFMQYTNELIEGTSEKTNRDCIFSRVRPIYEWAVSDLDP